MTQGLPSVADLDEVLSGITDRRAAVEAAGQSVTEAKAALSSADDGVKAPAVVIAEQDEARRLIAGRQIELSRARKALEDFRSRSLGSVTGWFVSTERELVQRLGERQEEARASIYALITDPVQRETFRRNFEMGVLALVDGVHTGESALTNLRNAKRQWQVSATSETAIDVAVGWLKTSLDHL